MPLNIKEPEQLKEKIMEAYYSLKPVHKKALRLYLRIGETSERMAFVIRIPRSYTRVGEQMGGRSGQTIKNWVYKDVEKIMPDSLFVEILRERDHRNMEGILEEVKSLEEKDLLKKKIACIKEICGIKDYESFCHQS